ncbi:hypothetical protein NLC93_06270, partial [Candidatus Aminicenantes bacterium AC-335-G13]|nr:hypothetical protein [Candidatus Aminicenantes bacterium AC-335-G13]
NSGAEIFNDKIILTPRCHKGYYKSKFFDEKLGIERFCLENYISEVWPLISEDGVHFKRFNNLVIRGDGTEHKDFTYGIEDIRIIKVEEKYLLVGCGKVKPPFKGEKADRIAIYSTEDFKDIKYHGIVKSFDSRNAVLFPEPINGKYFILLRFYPNIHLDYLEGGLEQLLNPSKYEKYWGEIYRRREETLLLEAGEFPHEREKIGPGPQIVKTEKGWLLIYHSVGEISEEICEIYGVKKRIERGYSVCAALLDLENPKKVLRRTKYPIYIPSAPYELSGNEEYPVDVPYVVFPTGAIVKGDKLVLYAGAGDKYIILLSCDIKNLVEYLWNYCK